MDQEKKESAKDIEGLNPSQRQLIVAYLSYALDDVRELGGIGLQLLQMTIAEIAEEPAPNDPDRPLQSTVAH